MPIVHAKRNCGLTPAGYGARVAFAVAVIAIGLKIGADYWPCDFAQTAACRLAARHASAAPATPATVVFLGTSGSNPLSALAGKMAAAAEDKQLGAEITGIARPTAKAPAGL
jgi:hypothetical protein